ncbi:MAG TPA: PQQ-binding-like beta-propeller repeat protein [Candidatus Hydrogenedentes bacterium]|nr:PQQ-binding-like beta-propeller repeat protein [Candidatus Hydrogenedentota bacterium]
MKRPLRNTFIISVLFVLSMAVAGVFLWWWLTQDPTLSLQARLPGTDGTPPASESKGTVKDLAGTFQQFDGTPADLPGAWPRFRGSDFDNICKDSVKLAESWGENGPTVLWKVELGEGHAAPVVLAGRVYLLDYDEKKRADAIRCFSLADGREIWRRSYGISVKRNHGMSRTIPAVTENYLVTIGPRCHVVCLDAVSGAFKWGIDLQKDYGTKEPLWYTGQCPLIDDNKVILAPCGTDVLMMAVDCETGSAVWKTPNTKKWNMSHSSIIPATIAGKKMYVYCAVGGITGVSREAGDAGKTLWQLPWAAKVIAPSPVPLEDGKIFLTAGYGEGGMMIQVHENNGEFTAEVLYKHGPKDGMACEQQTPIYYDGLLYSIMPKDAGALRCQFVCYRPDGTLAWSSEQSNRFGLGPYLLADGKFYILNDDGMLTVIKASKDGFEPLGHTQVLHGQDAWGPIALAGDRMLLRDSKQMVCIAAGAT